MIEYLNQHIGILTLFFTAMVAVSTVVYVILTGLLVAETRNMRRAQTEPNISISYRMRDEYMALLDFVVSNIGMGPAYDVYLEVKEISGGKSAESVIGKLHEINFVKSGLKYLAPGKEMASFFENVNEDFEGKMATKISIKATYRNASQRIFEEEFTLDFSELRGISFIGTPDLHKIAKSLENIQRDFGHIVSGFKKLNVDIFTESDREERARETREWIEEQKQRRVKPAGTDEASSDENSV